MRIQRPSTFTILAVLLILTYVQNADARTWHVHVDGGGDVPTIQAAIDSSVTGDDVLLSAGTYTWANQQASGETMLQLKPGVEAHSTDGAATTIVSGDGIGRVLRCDAPGNYSIRGVTLQSGIAAVSTTSIQCGGAVFAASGTALTMTDCVIKGNSGEANVEGIGGGAVSCDVATFTRCQFLDNTVYGVYGGVSRGGAVFATNVSTLDSDFRGNRGLVGGDGGAIYASTITVQGGVFEGNGTSSFLGAAGGALSCSGSYSLTGALFRNNSVLDEGDAEALGGAFYASPGSHGSVIDCRFDACVVQVSGTAFAKGGAISTDGSLTVRRTAFTRNAALIGTSTGDSYGGAVWGGELVEQCTFMANGAYGGGSAVCTPGIVRSCLIVGGNDVIGTVECCDFFGGISGTDGGHNFSADPLFCASDPIAAADFSLHADSPCLRGHHPQGTEACGDIGSSGMGCPSVAVQATSWSAMKRLYR